MLKSRTCSDVSLHKAGQTKIQLKQLKVYQKQKNSQPFFEKSKIFQHPDVTSK